jgi:hypothetical protein
LEGATFPKIEPSEPLAVKFTMLWYLSNMVKKWQSNEVFHTYYLQLKRAIESFPRMMSNTLHMFRPFVKFYVDRHFIYIIVHGDEHQEELQSCYKITEEEMEEITKEWPTNLLIPADKAELSDPDLIESPMVTREEYDAHRSSRRKKKEEVKELKNASKETASESPGGGGNDKVEKEEDKGEEDKKKQGEVTMARDPLDEVETSKKIKVSPTKPTLRKKSKDSKR